MVTREQLAANLGALLQPDNFKDYCPNGLQVEGRPSIRKVVAGVTASLALIEAAIRSQADAIVVHHGLFWRGHDGRVTGWMRKRLGALLAHDINLFAYHLPLDAHPELGNNAQLGLQLGFGPVASYTRFADQSLCFIAEVDMADAQALASHASAVLGRPATLVAGDGRRIRRVAWCTGGAQGYFEAAMAAGADAFITGEISEPQAHLARESGVSFLACGHHATERYGAPAVVGHVAGELGLQWEFIDVDNPA